MDEEKKISPVEINIKDFQSIEDLSFSVHGFTCITGPTNIGKSAILRSISKSLLNDPVVGLIRKGKKFVTVGMKSEGWEYKWEKGEGGVNRYNINGKLFDKTGQNQLQEIKDIGFGSIDIGSDEINPWYAHQLEPIFLLNRPGSQVTEFISEVSRLNVIQNAILASAKGKKDSLDLSKLKSSEIEKANKKLQNFGPLDNLNTLAVELEDQLKSIDKYKNLVSKLNKLNDIITNCEQEIFFLKPIEKLNIPDVILSKSEINSIKEMNDWALKLQFLAKQIISLKEIKNVSVPNLEEEFNQLKGLLRYKYIISLSEDVAFLQPVKSIKIDLDISIEIDKLKEMNRINAVLLSHVKEIRKYQNVKRVSLPEMDKLPNIDKYRRINSILQNLNSEVHNLEKDYEKTEKELKSVEKKMQQIPVCPSCNRPTGTHENH